MTFEEWCENAICHPEHRFTQSGNEIQIHTVDMLGIRVVNRTFFPYDVFKNISETYVPDIILTIDVEVPNGRISTCYYTEEGYGMPEFDNEEQSKRSIKVYNEGIDRMLELLAQMDERNDMYDNLEPDDWKKMDEMREMASEEFFKLFKKYFYYLWD